MSEFNNNMEDLLKQTRDLLLENKSLKDSDIRMYNPLVLAYVGDSVYDTFIRTMLVSNGSVQVNKLHKRSIKFVSAKAQAEITEQLSNILTEDEQDILRRGRNTKSNSVPKNADMNDYRYATGFEALIGYLYLMGSTKRLMELFGVISKMER
jgi:ribonuclease III family protein